MSVHILPLSFIYSFGPWASNEFISSPVLYLNCGVGDTGHWHLYNSVPGDGKYFLITNINSCICRGGGGVFDSVLHKNVFSFSGW